MVAKISSGTSIFAALAYNQKKLEKQQAKVLLVNRMIEPRDGKYTIGSCVRSFQLHLDANIRTRNPILHISLNPDPKDVLTDNQFSKLALEYMQRLGYGNQPFIVYKHEDIDRHHLHIVSVRVDENGKKLDHNFEHRKSMEICRKLEQQYHLIPADKKEQPAALLIKPIHYGETDLKAQLAAVIRPIVKSYFFQSMGEYKALLSLFNIEVEEITGKVGDKLYNGLVYSALNEKGTRIGKPFKSSLFGKEVGYEAIRERMQQSGTIIKEKQLTARTKAVVAKVLQQRPDRANFETELAKNSIQVIFRQNATERIYGVTFVDYQNKSVINGSRLGKEFSANVFNGLFNAPHLESEKQSQQQYTRIGHSVEPDFVPQRETDSGIGSIFRIFNVENEGTDMEEEAFIRRMRRKKKRKKKMG